MTPSGMALGLAGAGLASTVFVAFALARPHTEMARATDLAPVAERRADALARTAPTREADRARAMLETRRSLSQAPANPTAWVRLAYLDSVSEEGLSAGGERALAASYVVAPYGPDVTTWRLSFALNHWSSLSGNTRKAALDELRVTGIYMPHGRLKRSVSDPSGRLALELTLHTVALEKRRR